MSMDKVDGHLIVWSSGSGSRGGQRDAVLVVVVFIDHLLVLLAAWPTPFGNINTFDNLAAVGVVLYGAAVLLGWLSCCVCFVRDYGFCCLCDAGCELFSLFVESMLSSRYGHGETRCILLILFQRAVR